MRSCVDCGVSEEETHISKRNNLCRECAYERCVESIRQMRAKEGPIYQRWESRVKFPRKGKPLEVE